MQNNPSEPKHPDQAMLNRGAKLRKSRYLLRERFINGFLDRLAGLAGPLLNPADHFVIVSFIEAQVIVGQISPFLLQLAFGNVPIAFHFELIHKETYAWEMRWRLG
jgi:hypothetical protein